MKKHFKPHVVKMSRYQTSTGRDLEEGLRLDRNEKVSNFSEELMEKIFGEFSTYSLSASPDSQVLYQKISKSIGVLPENIYVTAGITEGIRFLYESLANPGENVIVLDPTYPMYMVYANLFQLEYRKFSYGQDMIPDGDSLYSQMDEKTKFVIIPNPNLPIESCFSFEEIKKIAIACRDRDIILVVDEAYHFFGGPSVLELIHEFDNLIIMRTFSKAYGLAGLRLGFMVSQKENIEYISKTRSLVESNTLTMGVAEYFIDHPEIREDHVSEVKGGQEYLRNEFDRLGLKYYGGKVTNGILIFLESEKESKELVLYMRERKIYIRGAFEGQYDKCVRISIGPEKMMKRFIETLEEWLEKRNRVK